MAAPLLEQAVQCVIICLGAGCLLPLTLLAGIRLYHTLHGQLSRGYTLESPEGLRGVPFFLCVAISSSSGDLGAGQGMGGQMAKLESMVSQLKDNQRKQLSTRPNQYHI